MNEDIPPSIIPNLTKPNVSIRIHQRGINGSICTHNRNVLHIDLHHSDQRSVLHSASGTGRNNGSIGLGRHHMQTLHSR